MIVAGIGSRKGVSANEVFSAIEAALAGHGLAVDALSALATTGFKRDEAGILLAAQRLRLPLIVVETAEEERTSPPPGSEGEDWRQDGEAALFCETHEENGASSAPSSPQRGGSGRHGAQTTTPTCSRISQAVAGTPSVSETAAFAAAGPGGRLLGPRIVVGRVTCAIAVREGRP